MASSNEPHATSSKQASGSSNALPPGMVMGPDGKPCKICTAFRHWKPGTTEPDSSRDTKSDSRTQKKKQAASAGVGAASGFAAFAAAAGTGTTSTGANTGASTSAAGTTSHKSRLDGSPEGCPPDVEQLGRATWTFLHTTAAYYPEKPTPNQRANMLMLLRSLPILYPCSWCALDFGKNIESHPPDVSGRVALSRWLCERHNEVNEKLGKEHFDCAKVDERWKDGPPDGSCD